MGVSQLNIAASGQLREPSEAKQLRKQAGKAPALFGAYGGREAGAA